MSYYEEALAPISPPQAAPAGWLVWMALALPVLLVLLGIGFWAVWLTTPPAAGLADNAWLFLCH